MLVPLLGSSRVWTMLSLGLHRRSVLQERPDQEYKELWGSLEHTSLCTTTRLWSKERSIVGHTDYQDHTPLNSRASKGAVSGLWHFIYMLSCFHGIQHRNIWQTLVTSALEPSYSLRQNYCPRFTGGETKAHVGDMTCLRAHSKPRTRSWTQVSEIS